MQVTDTPKKVVFLVSGNGGSLKFIHQAIQRLGLPLEVSAVIADRECGALAYARAVGLPSRIIRYTRKSPAALQQALGEFAADAVVTNIHKIIDAETLGLLPGRFINLHYSILPAFKGLIGMETVEQARELNATMLGATCHEVDEEVDNGQCISQFAVGVDWLTNTVDTVYDLVFRGACLTLLQGLIQRVYPSYNAEPAREQTTYLNHSFLFAPQLSFAATALDEPFWADLKQG
jgi:phosphoribosylglycinamide formyltransferase-1